MHLAFGVHPLTCHLSIIAHLNAYLLEKHDLLKHIAKMCLLEGSKLCCICGKKHQQLEYSPQP